MSHFIFHSFSDETDDLSVQVDEHSMLRSGIFVSNRPIVRNNPDSFKQLWDVKPDKPDQITLRGRTYNEHRCNSIYTIDGQGQFNYSGKTLISRGDYSKYTLLDRCMEVSKVIFPTVPFNTAFVNWYTDGSEYVGAHADNITELVPQTPIISFTFLEDPEKKRIFTVNRFDNNSQIKQFPLGDGDCVIMTSSFQTNYKHGVPKMAIKKTCKRINVTIRAFK